MHTPNLHRVVRSASRSIHWSVYIVVALAFLTLSLACFAYAYRQSGPLSYHQGQVIDGRVRYFVQRWGSEIQYLIDIQNPQGKTLTINVIDAHRYTQLLKNKSATVEVTYFYASALDRLPEVVDLRLNREPLILQENWQSREHLTRPAGAISGLFIGIFALLLSALAFVMTHAAYRQHRVKQILLRQREAAARPQGA